MLLSRLNKLHVIRFTGPGFDLVCHYAYKLEVILIEQAAWRLSHSKQLYNKKGSAPSVDDYKKKKKYAPLGATALILVECS